METIVRIPTPLRTLTGGADEVTASGKTVGDVIEDLERSTPVFASVCSTKGCASLREYLCRRGRRTLPRRASTALNAGDQSASFRRSPGAEARMDRYARQARLAEVGVAGQERILRTFADVPLDGAAGDVAARYLGGAGVASFRVRDGSIARQPGGSRRALIVVVDPTLAVESDGDAFDLRDPAVAISPEARALPCAPSGIDRSRAVPRSFGRAFVSRWHARRFESVIDAVGNTPMVRLNRVSRHTPDVEVWAKLEFANPGGSVKDRPALRMIQDALADKRMTRDKILIDSTSGTRALPTRSSGPRSACAFGWSCLRM